LKEWDKAITDYSKAIQLKPEAWEAWSGRAFVHFNRQQWDGAIADFSKAIHLAPQVHTNWWHRGHSYLQLTQWDKAAADFGKVVDRWPDGSEGWYLRAVAFAQLKQPDKALTDLRQAIAKGFNNVEQLKNDPQLAPLRTREGFGKLVEELQGKEKLRNDLLRQKKLEDAIAALRKAPKSAKAHTDLGAALRAQGKLDEAITAFRKAIDLDPKSTSAHNNLGYTLEAQGKLDEAIACYRRSIELVSKPSWAHNRLGYALGKKGWELANCPDPKLRDPKRAIEASKEAVGFAPQSVLAWQYLGWVQYRTGNWKASIEALETSCKLQNPGDCGQWIVMSLAHWKLANEKGLPEEEQARHQAETRRWYERAVKQIDSWKGRRNDSVGGAIWDFRAEALKLIGPNGEKK
jgi:superkiller protein 3